MEQNLRKIMSSKNNPEIEYASQPSLHTAKDLVYDKCGLQLSQLSKEPEGLAYGACTFKLNNASVHFRVAKITPLKTGQFVAIWKRNEKRTTIPFDSSDEIDFLIVAASNEKNSGQFIFPKLILLQQGIITGSGKAGKRGMRVYPPWDLTNNKQAQKTQQWQATYFLPISTNSSIDIARAKLLLHL